jgi:hypothetical protein
LSENDKVDTNVNLMKNMKLEDQATFTTLNKDKESSSHQTSVMTNTASASPIKKGASFIINKGSEQDSSIKSHFG